MRILPVIDLMDGVVVRGVAGRRHEYKPIGSTLTSSVQPLAIARAFREHFGVDELYVADLDAIAGKPPASDLFQHLHRDGFRLWVDAGIGSDGANLNMLSTIGVNSIIAGLESLSGPEDLASFVQRDFESRLVFSLDLKNGQPIAGKNWAAQDAWTIAKKVVGIGIRRILVLDLADVGTNQGPRTHEICRRLRAAFSDLEITTGGGIRGSDDLRQLQCVGVNFALVASALHDGRLTREHLAEVR